MCNGSRECNVSVDSRGVWPVVGSAPTDARGTIVTTVPEQLYVVEVQALREEGEVRLVPIVAMTPTEARLRAARIIAYWTDAPVMYVRAARNGEWDSLHDAIDDWYGNYCDYADGDVGVDRVTDAEFTEVVGWYHPTWCSIDAGCELQALEEGGIK